MTAETIEPPIEELLQDIAPEVPREDLKIADRCDQCGAQAYVAVAFASDVEVDHPGELLFCGHHFAKYEDKLREHVVKDQRDVLNERLVSSY